MIKIREKILKDMWQKERPSQFSIEEEQQRVDLEQATYDLPQQKF